MRIARAPFGFVSGGVGAIRWRSGCTRPAASRQPWHRPQGGTPAALPPGATAPAERGQVAPASDRPPNAPADGAGSRLVSGHPPTAPASPPPDGMEGAMTDGAGSRLVSGHPPTAPASRPP